MADFPSFWITGTRQRREMEIAPAWADVTDSYEYEDGGKDFNERSDVAPVRWEYVVDCLGSTAAQARDAASVYHTFWNTYRLSRPFNFKDKYGITWKDVRIESYDRSHDAHKSWSVAVTFQLVSFTAEIADTTPPSTPVLTITGHTDTTVSLSWEPSTD